MAFVDALVFYLLNVRQTVHHTAEVGFQYLWVRGLTFHVFAHKKSFFSFTLFPSKNVIFSALSFTVCMYIPLSHLCGWPAFCTNMHPCRTPSHAELNGCRELRMLPFSVKHKRESLSWNKADYTFNMEKKIKTRT